MRLMHGDYEFSVQSVVMQPTSFCNIDCTYCYLPFRHANQIMSEDIAENVAEGLAGIIDRSVNVIWHGGEPLTCGIRHVLRLIQPFELLRQRKLVTHVIQTNATLIDEKWCGLFKTYGFEVGISIDGPAWANKQRLSRGKRDTFLQSMQGIKMLRDNGVPFSAICVVTEETIGHAVELYQFFCELGCHSVGFNVEEKVGIHTKCCSSVQNVRSFWKNLFEAWSQTPTVLIREFNHVLTWMNALCRDGGKSETAVQYDIFPSVSRTGDVVFLSPEFLDAHSSKYHNFIVGNVREHSLAKLVKKFHSLNYVSDFLKGVERCRRECGYFEICRGGDASNKFFEHGTTNATETVHCTNTKQQLTKAILEVL